MNRRRPAHALASGFVALTAWRLAAILTVWTVIPALFAATPLAPALRDGFAGTLAGDHVLRNEPAFAATDVFDFLHENRAAVAGTTRTAEFAILFGVVVQIFFAGGFVQVLGRAERPLVLDFVAGARRNFWHNVKCFAIFAAALAAATAVWIGAASAAGRSLFAASPPGDPARTAFRLGVTLVTLLLYAVLSLWHDFARAARRLDGEIGAWRGYGVARRSLAARPVVALTIFAIWLLLGAFVVAALFATAWTLRAVSVASIALLFVIQLATLLARSFVRIGMWGSSIALFESSPVVLRTRAARSRAEELATPALVPEPPPEPVGPFWDETPLV